MNLHNEIMNLALPSRREIITLQGQGELAYKYGHRDCRHSAAELAIQADSRIEELEQRLTCIVEWLEQNQEDVFRRGLWDALGDTK